MLQGQHKSDSESIEGLYTEPDALEWFQGQVVNYI